MMRSDRTFGFRFFPAACGLAIALAAGLGTVANGQEESSQVLNLESETDRLPITATYFPADEGKVEGGLENAPVVVMMHGGNGDRLVWEKKPTVFNRKPLAKVLHDEGFAVVTVDVRGHGESPLPEGREIRTRDYQDMLGDMEAIKKFLMDEHQAKRLNVNKLGLVAADDLTPLALAFTQFDWEKPDYDDAPTAARRTPRGRDVRALVLLSPVAASGNLKSYPVTRLLRDPRARIATFIGYGTSDPQDKGVSERLARQLRIDPKKPEDGFFLQSYDARSRGTDLIGQPKLRAEMHVVNFLKKFLLELDSPWRNRTSRLLR